MRFPTPCYLSIENHDAIVVKKANTSPDEVCVIFTGEGNAFTVYLPSPEYALLLAAALRDYVERTNQPKPTGEIQ